MVSPNATNILFIRTDAIGDNVISSSMLPVLAKHFDNAKVTIICQEHIAHLYSHCPFISNIVTVSKNQFYGDATYRNFFLRSINKLSFDLVLNPIYSRDWLADSIASSCNAPQKIAFSTNDKKNNTHYSQLITKCDEFIPEIEKCAIFLRSIDIDTSQTLKPIMWLSKQDEEFAENFFEETDIPIDNTIILCAGAQSKQRRSTIYGIPLDEICVKYGMSVVAIGAKEDYTITEAIFSSIEEKTINLCGQTTIRQAAALIKKSRLVVGAETGMAHVACAVNTPNVILIGGGHFGRFMPYSHLTTLVCNPLSCFKCNWECTRKKTDCIENIEPKTLEAAITHALENPCQKVPAIFAQTSTETDVSVLSAYENVIFVPIAIDRKPSNEKTSILT